MTDLVERFFREKLTPVFSIPQHKKMYTDCYICHTSHVNADTAKLDVRYRGDSRGTEDLQGHLESLSQGSIGDLELLLQGYPLPTPLSWMTMVTMMMTIQNLSRQHIEELFAKPADYIQYGYALFHLENIKPRPKSALNSSSKA